MKKYLAIIKMSFLKMAEYRFNFLMRIVTNIIWYGVTLVFWLSMADSGMDVTPYTPKTLVIYYLLIGVISTIVGFPFESVAVEIRDGKISADILKPAKYILVKFFSTAADKAVMIILALAVFFVLISRFGFPMTLTVHNFPIFVLSLMLGAVGNYLVYFLTALTAFWLKHIHGIPALINVLSSLISGTMIPIELLPPVFLQISRFMPFRYFHFFPIQIFLGNFSAGDIYEGFLIEFAWIVLLVIIYKFMWNRGMKQLEVIGT